MEEHSSGAGNSEYGKGLDCQYFSPISTVEPSFTNGSCNSDTKTSITLNGKGTKSVNSLLFFCSLLCYISYMVLNFGCKTCENHRWEGINHETIQPIIYKVEEEISPRSIDDPFSLIKSNYLQK